MADGAAGAGPKYQRIADDLRDHIRVGRYPVGSTLPSDKKLMAQYHAALNTVASAIGVLRNEGLIQSAQGSGKFVIALPGATPEPGDDEIGHRLDAAEMDIRELFAKLGYPQPSHQQGANGRKARHDRTG